MNREFAHDENIKPGGMVLRETLQQLLSDPSGRLKQCKLGTIINSQDSETKAIFIEALKSDASTMSLVRALKEEGIFLSREYLGEKRSNCFRGDGASCCLISIDKAKDTK